jgi:hypothetical protein
MSMRVSFACLLAISVLGADVALAASSRLAVPPPPDLAGKGSGNAFGKAVRQALIDAKVRVAPVADVVRAAKAAKVGLKPRLKVEQVPRLISRGGFYGVVLFRKGRNGAFAQLIDGSGQVTLERLVRFGSTGASGTDCASFASAVAQALGAGPTAPVQPSGMPSPSPAVVEVAPPPAALPTPPPSPVAESSETAAALAGPEVPSVRSTEPAAGYYFKIGLFGGAAERRFLTPTFSYVSGYPYGQGGVSLELFPFQSFGLGLVGDFSFGQAKDQIAGGAGTFNSTDLRVDAALAYRLRLFAGPYGTFLIPRVGFGLRDFDAPSSIGLPGDNRIFLVAGLAASQPLVPKYLRVSAGVAALPLSKLQGAAQTDYGPSSSIGLEWMAELGGDIVFGLEWALQAEQERFMDSYTGPPTASGVEIDTSYSLQLRYRL